MPYLVYGGAKLNPDEAPSADAVGIPDSLVILEFLADLFPAARLLPADPIQRAQARLFAAFVEKKLLPAWFPSIFMGAPTDGVFVVLDEIQRKLPPTAGFLFGEWSIADASFLPGYLRMLLVLEINPAMARLAMVGETSMDEICRAPSILRPSWVAFSHATSPDGPRRSQSSASGRSPALHEALTGTRVLTRAIVAHHDVLTTGYGPPISMMTKACPSRRG